MEKGVDSKIISNRKNTEIFLAPSLNADPQLEEGKYIITFVITDGETGRSCEILKNIAIGQFFSAGVE